jgi:phage baseplate assembly protein W
MGSFNFKSSGQTQEQKLIETLTVSKTPIGIKTPLQISDGENTEILVTYDNLADTVNDNLRNLLLTNWGERVGLYDFGANLRPLMSDLVSAEDFDGRAVEKIYGAVSRWMPYVSLENYVATTDHSDNKNTAHITIRLTYSIPTLNVTSKMIEIDLYPM